MRPSGDVHDADWAITRLDAEHAYEVRGLVPPVFEAYVRLLHPLTTADRAGRRLIRWRDLAGAAELAALGRRVQFHMLADRAGVNEPGIPSHGHLPDEDLAMLGDVLPGHTGTTGRCWFGVWTGYGPTGDVPSPGITRPAPLAREYYLYTGALSDVGTLRPGPGIWWPDDRAWFVATDVDLDSTYIGGPAALADQLLKHPHLEALPAEPDDSVTHHQ